MQGKRKSELRTLLYVFHLIVSRITSQRFINCYLLRRIDVLIVWTNNYFCIFSCRLVMIWLKLLPRNCFRRQVCGTYTVHYWHFTLFSFERLSEMLFRDLSLIGGGFWGLFSRAILSTFYVCFCYLWRHVTQWCPSCRASWLLLHQWAPHLWRTWPLLWRYDGLQSQYLLSGACIEKLNSDTDRGT